MKYRFNARTEPINTIYTYKVHTYIQSSRPNGNGPGRSYEAINDVKLC